MAPREEADASRHTSVASPETVSVIVPLFNDRAAVDACCRALADQEQRLSRITEVFLVDGRSTDGTRAEIERWAATDPRFQLVDNPSRYVPAGLNLALALVSTDVIVRVD